MLALYEQLPRLPSQPDSATCSPRSQTSCTVRSKEMFLVFNVRCYPLSDAGPPRTAPPLCPPKRHCHSRRAQRCGVRLNFPDSLACAPWPRQSTLDEGPSSSCTRRWHPGCSARQRSIVLGPPRAPLTTWHGEGAGGGDGGARMRRSTETVRAHESEAVRSACGDARVPRLLLHRSRARVRGTATHREPLPRAHERCLSARKAGHRWSQRHRRPLARHAAAADHA